LLELPAGESFCPVGGEKEAALKNQGCESHEKIMQQP